MERFQNYLKNSSHEASFYDFEGAEIEVRGVKKKGHGCDYAVLTMRGSGCEVVSVECEGGELGIGDFHGCVNQLSYSIDFVKGTFDDPPDLAVICYERSSAQVLNHLRVALNKKLRHCVVCILRRFSEGGYCSVCSSP